MKNKKNIYVLTSIAISFLICELISFFILSNSSVKQVDMGTFVKEKNSIDKIDPNISVFGDTYNNEKIRHPYFGYNFDMLEASDIHGFVGNEKLLPFKKQNNQFVIALFGGSVAQLFGYYVREYKIKELKDFFVKKYNLKDKEIIFLNLARGGIKQPQQFLMFTYFSDYIDFFVNIEGYNEVAESAYPRVPHAFPSSAEFYINSPEFRKYFKSIEENRRKLKKLNQIFKDYIFLNYSQTMKLLWNLYFNKYSNQLKNDLNKIYASNTQNNVRFKYLKETFNEINSTRVDNLKKFELKQYDIARALKIRGIFILQPHFYIDNSKIFTPLENSFRSKSKKVKKNMYLELKEFYQYQQTKNYPFFDFTMIYSEISEQIYSDQCCHLNQRGEEIMFDNLLKSLNSYKFK